MKPVNEWDEDYLLNNIPPGEYDWLEFKGSRALDLTLDGVQQHDVLQELGKQVSAFSNSGGGVLIYGVKDPREEITVDDGGVSLIIKGKISTKEWLEDVIPGQVDFPLKKFNVYVIRRSGPESQIEEGKGIFLIDIPDSVNAPHQSVRDRRYYARVGGKSRPISHRMIMDMIGRRKSPEMELNLKFLYHKKPPYDVVSIKLYCENKGKVFAKYVNGFLYVPEEMNPRSDYKEIFNFDGKKYKKIYFSNIHEDCVGEKTIGYASFPYYITRYDPVLPGVGFDYYISIDISKKDLKEISENNLIWEIYADNMDVVKGKIQIGKIKYELYSKHYSFTMPRE